MEQHWLTLLIVILIVGIIFDGVRRMRKAKRDSIKMALKPAKRKVDEPSESGEAEAGYGSEFPNGGARVSERKIDPDRINEARNKYNFGTDMSAWKSKVAEKIAEHTGINKGTDDSDDKKAPRIEPSFENADPLLDNVNETAYTEELDVVEESREEELEAAVAETSTSHADSAQDGIQAEELVTASDDMEEAAPRDLGRSAAISQREDKEPVQVSLNLEDSVPMLMDSLSESDTSITKQDGVSLELDDGVAKDLPESIVTVGTHIEPAHEEERTLDARSANKPRYESKYADHSKAYPQEEHSQKQHSQKQVEAPQEVLVIHIRAAKNEYFYGSDLLELILDNGLRFGAMDIFHRHAGEDGEGPILFSMANMVKPGVFDLHTFEEFSTVGLSFFLGLPTETGSDMQAFDVMLSTAQDIAEKLQGELKDENRSVLTKQTIEHYRERIRDFARRQQLEKNKP